jgi:hypothetical protein
MGLTSTLLEIPIRPKGMEYTIVIQFALGVSVKWIGTPTRVEHAGQGQTFFFS